MGKSRRFETESGFLQGRTNDALCNRTYETYSNSFQKSRFYIIKSGLDLEISIPQRLQLAASFTKSHSKRAGSLFFLLESVIVLCYSKLNLSGVRTSALKYKMHTKQLILYTIATGAGITAAQDAPDPTAAPGPGHMPPLPPFMKSVDPASVNWLTASY